MKIYVKDDDGKSYIVENVEEKTPVEEVKKTEETKTKDEALTEDEIKALKSLAAIADKLIALTESKDESIEKTANEELTDDNDEDEIIETKSNDSRKSFNSIAKKNVVKDSSIDAEEEISNAWMRRYGGK